MDNGFIHCNIKINCGIGGTYTTKLQLYLEGYKNKTYYHCLSVSKLAVAMKRIAMTLTINQI